MLNIIFQTAKANNPKSVIVDCRQFFSLYKKVSWFEDPFVQKVMQVIDGVKYISGFVLETKEGIAIPPEYLSTGAKTAICIYEYPEKIFNLTQMGNNVIPFIVDLADSRDITALTYREIPYDYLEGGFTKDYKPVELGEEPDVSYYDLVEKWLEEIYND